MISSKDGKDLQASWFSTSSSKRQMLESLASFHDETAQNNRMKIVVEQNCICFMGENSPLEGKSRHPAKMAARRPAQ